METVVIVLVVVAALQLLFMGSSADAGGIRLRVLGLFTLYDDRQFWTESDIARIAHGVVAQEMTAKLEGFLATRSEEDQPEPDSEDKDLWGRLEAAGFETIDEDRDLRLTDDGKIDWKKSDSYECALCKGPVIELWELYRPTSPSPKMVGRIKKHPPGYVCRDCGAHEWITNGPRVSIGVLAPYLEEGANFFDILDKIAEERRPKEPAPAAAAEGDAGAGPSSEAVSTGGRLPVDGPV